MKRLHHNDNRTIASSHPTPALRLASKLTISMMIALNWGGGREVVSILSIIPPREAR
jgi:hypothetical protein